MADESKQVAAPYLPFKTFQTALEAFTTHGVPPLIDRGIWRTQPGGVQGLIMGALRFFDLIDSDNRPTPLLEKYVAHPSDKRQKAVRELLEHGYAELIQQDLTKMTAKMLDDAMETYGVSGETKKKATTFFLQAAKFSDLPLSSFLQTQIRATPGTRKKRSGNGRPKENGEEVETLTSERTQPKGEARTIELESGGTLTVSFSVDIYELSPEDRNFVFGLIDSLKKYGSQKSHAQHTAQKEGK